MGANEARHVLEMTQDLAHVIALEIYTAAQALDYRRDMINAARELAKNSDTAALAAKIQNSPLHSSPDHAIFMQEVEALRVELANSEEFQASKAVRAVLQRLRRDVSFMVKDRAMDVDIRAVLSLFDQGELLMAAKSSDYAGL